MKIKIGIIGYGKIGQTRHKILKEFKDISKIVHIVDKKKLNIRKVKCSTNYKDIIKDPEITNHSKLTKDISNYSQNHMLQNWMRPALRNMELIYSTLTNEIREYLQNNVSSKFIAQKLEDKINKIIKNEANI